MMKAKTRTAQPDVIWDFLKSWLGNDFGVAGLMGNLQAESALIPINLQNTYNTKFGLTDDQYTDKVDDGSYTNFVKDAGGYGLAQWTYWTRKQNMLNYCKAHDASIGNLEAQLGFLQQELIGYKLDTALKNAKSVREASDVILLQFERPADQSERARVNRASMGQKFFDKYAGKPVQPTPTPAPSPTPAPVKPTQPDSGTSKVDYAESFDKAIAGTYLVTASALNMRSGASTSKKILAVLPKGTKVQNYGYFTMNGNVKWLYVKVGNQTGFCSGQYLKKA